MSYHRCKAFNQHPRGALESSFLCKYTKSGNVPIIFNGLLLFSLQAFKVSIVHGLFPRGSFCYSRGIRVWFEIFFQSVNKRKTVLCLGHPWGFFMDVSCAWCTLVFIKVHQYNLPPKLTYFMASPKIRDSIVNAEKNQRSEKPASPYASSAISGCWDLPKLKDPFHICHLPSGNGYSCIRGLTLLHEKYKFPYSFF